MKLMQTILITGLLQLDTDIWTGDYYNNGYKYNGQNKTPMYVKTNYFTLTPQLVNRFGDNFRNVEDDDTTGTEQVLDRDFIVDTTLSGTIIDITGINKPVIENPESYSGEQFKQNNENAENTEAEQTKTTVFNGEVVLGKINN